MMNKVAFCLRGAVSKNEAFFTYNSLYKEGKYVDYIKCRNSIFKYIINKNPNFEIDFFCHGWNIDLKDDIENIYKPKKSLFENNNIYSDEIYKRCNNKNDFGGISQALTMKKTIELKEEYEKENNFQYDIVILYRYDILLWKDLILNDYNLNINNIYVNAHPQGNGDFHFIMSNNNSLIFKDLFDSPLKNNNSYRVHYWIKNYITKICNKNLIIDKIIPGQNQEVIRKIKKFSIDKGYLSQEMYDNDFDDKSLLP